MTKHAFFMLLGVTILVAFPAAADVTGSFNIDITMSPEGTQTEAVQFFVDIMSNLQFNSVFSGLTAGADLGFGATGIEFSILKMAANLGAITFKNDVVFAMPFGCALFSPGVSNTAPPGFEGACPGPQITPIADGTGNGKVDTNSVGFVKFRSDLIINIGGVDIENLMILEDVDFPDIQGGDDHEHDHFGGNVLYEVYAVNGETDDQTPTMGLGDVITISGQTVSGVTIVSETAICTSKTNYIKKRRWEFEVNKACASQAFGFIIEGGGTPFLVEEQRLWITGIGADNLQLDIHAVMSPLERSFMGEFTTSYTISELATVLVSVAAGSSGIERISAAAQNANTKLTMHFNDKLSVESVVGEFSFILSPNQNPLDLNLRLGADRTGFTDMVVTLGFARGGFRLSTTTFFGPESDSGGFDWSRTGFSVSGGSGQLNFGAEFSFSPSGISDVEAGVGFLF